MTRQQAPARANLVLAVLFAGAFVMGSAEMLVVGMLDLIATDLEVSVSAAGALVAAPIQMIRSSSTTTAAFVWMPSRSGPVPSQVTSSPIPVIKVLIMVCQADQKRFPAAGPVSPVGVAHRGRWAVPRRRPGRRRPRTPRRRSGQDGRP